MTLSATEAAAALQDVDSARAQSRELFIYRMASPYLLLWGTLWIVGGFIPVPIPANPSVAWMVLDAVGVAASLYISFTNTRRFSGVAAGRKSAWRYGATFAVVFLFALATVIVFEARNAGQGMTFAALLTSAIFAAVGIWTGLRYAAIGAALAAVAVAAHFLHVPHEVSVICFAGGATMMLGGFWMRRA